MNISFSIKAIRLAILPMIILVWFIPVFAHACTTIHENSVEISTKKMRLDDGLMEFRVFAKNTLSSPVALKLQFTLKNAEIIAGDNITNIAAKQTKEVIVIRSKNPKKSVSLRSKSSSQIGVFGSKPEKYIYRLPYKIGAEFVVTQAYKAGVTHKGNLRYAVDWKMNVGTPIYAARGGVVIASCEIHAKGGYNSSLKSKANRIEILHEDGTIATYAHLKKNGSEVRVGNRVKKGQLIGYSGNTGFTSAPHLHFQVGYLDRTLRIKTIPTTFLTLNGSETMLRGKSYTAIR